MYKNFLIVPDSFKGTMSAIDVCRIMAETLQERFPEVHIDTIPMADGGEGTVDAFLAANPGERITCEVCGPYREPVEGFYGMLEDGTAVIEMAAAAGLPLVGQNRRADKTTTFGVGQLLLDALNRGAKKVIMGLGGSCTNEGGVGMAAACGVKFYDAAGAEFLPVGGTLSHISRIDVSGMNPRIRDIEIVTMCDIDNPMYGPTGAAHVFGPQKGADQEMVLFLDEGIKHLAEVIKRDLGQDIALMPGSGAAGAMGAGMVAFFGSRLQMGIETVLDTVRFADVIADADMIFTGEGKIDSQSLRGKVVIGVAKRAKLQNVPVTVIVGGADNDIDPAYGMGVTAVFSINRLPQDFSVSRHKSVENMTLTADNVLRLIKAAEQLKG
ncbi:MAG: glycerate kinase [Coriobacteriaceae bacterium]|nr:glycerate kinase [Coriobacteriaceae bacterium]